MTHRLWSRVAAAPADLCWEWQGHVLKKAPYGRLYFQGRRYLAHRLALELATGEPVDGDVLHRCDNPRCCNPAHLRVGTRGDNNRDRAAKDRSCRGEAVHLAKLSYSKAVEIRELRRQGLPLVEIAGRYGVTHQTISAVVSGKTWRTP